MQLWSSLQQKATLRFLQTYPTLQAVQAATVEQLAATLKQAGHPTANQVARTIVEAVHRPQLRADEVTIKTKSRLMLALVAQLLPLLEQLAAYDKEITTLFLPHADSPIFASLPGALIRLAPRMPGPMGRRSQAL